MLFIWILQISQLLPKRGKNEFSLMKKWAFHKRKPRLWHATTSFILTTFLFLITFLDVCRKLCFSYLQKEPFLERHRDINNHISTELFHRLTSRRWWKMNAILTTVRRQFAVSRERKPPESTLGFCDNSTIIKLCNEFLPLQKELLKD